MKEVKFRVRLKSTKQIIGYEYLFNGHWFYEYLDRTGKWDELPGVVPISGLEVLKEQYTGLKDKNSKEIYEGDIIDNGVVIFDKKTASFDIKNGIIRLWGITEQNEVIGNIYENPELLGGGHD